MTTAQYNINDTSNKDYVFELNPHDVLLGRGPTSFNFEGNFRFIHVVENRRDEYRSTESTQHKNQIAIEIMKTIHNNNGRFVRQVKVPSELAKLALIQGNNINVEDSSSEKVYKIVSQAEAIDKIKHTLRCGRTAALPADNKKVLSSSSMIMCTKKKKPTPQRGSISQKARTTTAAIVTSKVKNVKNNVASKTVESSSSTTKLESIRRTLRFEQEINQQLKAEIAKKDARIQFLELQQQQQTNQYLVQQQNCQEAKQAETGRNTIGDKNTTAASSIDLLSRFSASNNSQQSSSGIASTAIQNNVIAATVQQQQDAGQDELLRLMLEQQRQQQSVNSFTETVRLWQQQQQMQQVPATVEYLPSLQALNQQLQLTGININASDNRQTSVEQQQIQQNFQLLQQAALIQQQQLQQRQQQQQQQNSSQWL